MNRSILIVICDFLLVSLLAFSTVDINKVAQPGVPQLATSAPAARQAAGRQDLGDVMRLALDEERKNRDQLLGELTGARALIHQQNQQIELARSELQTKEQLAARLAEELGKMPNTMLIEGHTDSKPFASDNGYSNWELSTDRANSARKLMEAHGLRPEQVNQVRGYADRELRHPDDPQHASNRRISVIVQYLAPKEGGPGAAAEPAEPGKGEAPKAAPPAPKEAPAPKK